MASEAEKGKETDRPFLRASRREYSPEHTRSLAQRDLCRFLTYTGVRSNLVLCQGPAFGALICYYSKRKRIHPSCRVVGLMSSVGKGAFSSKTALSWVGTCHPPHRAGWPPLPPGVCTAPGSVHLTHRRLGQHLAEASSHSSTHISSFSCELPRP